MENQSNIINIIGLGEAYLDMYKHKLKKSPQLSILIHYKNGSEEDRLFDTNTLPQELVTIFKTKKVENIDKIDIFYFVKKAKKFLTDIKFI